MADDLRADLGRLVRQLLEEHDARRTGEPIAPVLRAHLGEEAGGCPS